MKAVKIFAGLTALALLAGCSDMLSHNPNTAPTAVVSPGSITDLYPGVTVNLDGSDSFDSDDQEITYLWSVISGSDGYLSGSNTSAATFYGENENDFTVRLTVSDEYGTTDTTDVTITMDNTSPVPTGTFTPALGSIADNEAMTLSGTNIDDDPERGEECTFEFVTYDAPEGISASASGSGTMNDIDDYLATGSEDGAAGSITLAGAGVYTVRFVTTDEWGAQGNDYLVIATDSNDPPNAASITTTGSTGITSGSGTIGDRYMINELSVISIDLGATDPEDDTLDYTWTLNNFSVSEDLTIRVGTGSYTTHSAGDTIESENTPMGSLSANYDDISFYVESTTLFGSGDTFSIHYTISDGAESINGDIYFQIN